MGCARLGHRCEAVLFGALEADGPDVALCLACADGEPCAAVRCAGQGRGGSSVQVERDVFGELQEAAVMGAVVHRTPEELGLARVVRAEPEPPARGATFRRLSELMQVEAARAARAADAMRRTVRERASKLRTIRGVEVRMSAASCMGAEMIEGFAREAAQEGKTMGRGRKAIDNGVRDAVLADHASGGFTLERLAAKYAIGKSTLSRWLTERNRCERAPRPATAARPAQLVEIDPQRRGTADALINALAKRDAAAATVTLELTQAQLAQVVQGLAPNQVAAMIAAGLPAALATPRA